MCELLLRITLDIPIENFLEYFKSFFIICGIIILIYSIELLICLPFIFKKEGIKPYYAFIPFLNLYYYFKIFGTPFWTALVPIVNLVVLAVAPYLLAKQYECSKTIQKFSIIGSIFVIPYIAFSQKQNKRFKTSYNPLKSILEIDEIDRDSMDAQIDDYVFDEIYDVESENTYVSNVDNMINNIENEAISDDFEFNIDIDNTIFESTEKSTDLEKVNEIDSADIEQFTEEDMLEIFDTINESMSVSNIEELENKMENNKVKIIDNAEYKEIEEEKLSNEAIAFGGESNKNTISESKNKELTCPRCGSNLIGANDVCPGCGMKL